MLSLKSATVLPKLFNFFAFLFLVFSFFISFQPLYAASNSDLVNRIEGLEKKLEEIHKQQTTIIDKTQELSEKLDQVKVWAHRG